jgi:2-keto-3-deoxy-L-rhamnonate aldolase RhmA
MRKNSVKERVIAGEPVGGAMVFECFSPGIAQILVNAGCEFVLFDMEHTGLSLETLRWLFASCRGLPISPGLRVPRGEYHFLARALDAGAQCVMVPMVESAEQARAIAEATHYPPTGRRGAAFGFAHDDYEGGDVRAKMQALDARTLVIAQIETERGLANVEAIAATPGIDVLWVGHFDLSNFLGVPAQFDHPTFISAVHSVVAAARRNGKGLGYMATDRALAERWRGYGFNMIAAGTDPAVLQAAYTDIIQGVN